MYTPFENGSLVSVAIFAPSCITPVVMLLWTTKWKPQTSMISKEHHITVCHLSQYSWTQAKSSRYVCMVNFILRINANNCHNKFYCNIINMETLGRLWKSNQDNLWPAEVWTEYLQNTSLVHYQCETLLSFTVTQIR